MEIITCKKCGRKFAYEIVGTVYPGAKERESADCPYCGEEEYSVMTSQSIFVYEVNDEGKIIYKK